MTRRARGAVSSREAPTSSGAATNRAASTRSGSTRFLLTAYCLLLIAALQGCAGLSSPRLPILARGDTTHLVEDRYEDFPGAIHIHTTHSHDPAGPEEGVTRAPNDQR